MKKMQSDIASLRARINKLQKNLKNEQQNEIRKKDQIIHSVRRRKETIMERKLKNEKIRIQMSKIRENETSQAL